MINHKHENNSNCQYCNSLPVITPDQFDDNTRIGWRGPMILWENIEKLENEGFLFSYN